MRTGDIVSKLMQIESQPVSRLQLRKQKVQARDAAYQTIRGKLSTFQGSLQALFTANSVNTKSATVTAPSGTTAILTATATADAVSGSYQVSVSQLATASTAGTSKPVSKGVSTTAVLSSAGFTLTPTTGNFTINGVSIAVNAATDTLAQVVTRINAAGANVTAAVTNDLNGNPNGISLTPPAGVKVQLGSGADTSNFLTAAHLVATNVTGGVVSSNVPLSTATPGNALSTQPFNLPGATPTLAASGTLTINGTAITWANNDTLTTVLNRINSSSANVKATYDPTLDKVTLTNVGTGNQTISLSESAPPAGQAGLLTALGLTGANAVTTAGSTAQYTVAVNGGAPGPTQFSNTTTVTNALPGVTFNLTAVGTNNTVAINQDTGAAAKNVQAMVDAFNSLTDSIDTYTKYDPATKKGAILMGDNGIQNLQSAIKRMLSSPAIVPTGSAYTTLQDIGVSTGAYGSAPNSTNRLVLDSAKLSAALQNNPLAVFAVLSGVAGTATLTNSAGSPLGTGASFIQSITGSPTGVPQSGMYAITYNPALTPNNLSAVFTPAGGPAQPAFTGSIAASGVNSMIGGLTLTAKGAPVAGTEYVKYQLTTGGVLQTVNTYVSSVLATGGMFDAQSTSATDQSKRLDAQITAMNTRLAQRQQTLQRQFTRMEMSLSKLQMQGAALTQKLGY
jgi:flagellar hook-associated protein 2